MLINLRGLKSPKIDSGIPIGPKSHNPLGYGTGTIQYSPAIWHKWYSWTECGRKLVAESSVVLGEDTSTAIEGLTTEACENAKS
jgi:hypothetical protein